MVSEIDTVTVYPKVTDSHFIASNVNRKQCLGVIFGTQSTAYVLLLQSCSTEYFC